jgi:Ice-binding-like/Secretion system C-terminal sorting domain
MKNPLLHLILAFALLMVPGRNAGQAPDLGSTAGFAVFTSVGAFDNLGASNIVGDIGTNAGVFSGFPPGIVLGAIHVVDPVSAQASTDVETAYSFLFSLTCGAVIGTTMGSGQVLNPGIYCTGASTSIAGDLILDGLGDANSIFIFQIDGALSTSTFTNVILINGTTSCNVYWQVNGQFTLGDASVFMGTVVANGAITLLEASSLEGRVLTRAGSVNLNNNSITVCSGLLPITLLYFEAKTGDNNSCVNLNWETGMEVNSHQFLIERANETMAFQTIGKRNSPDTSTQVVAYAFTDENPSPGVNYYRLNHVDNDGSQEYSEVRSVIIEKSASAISIYPNPFSGTLTFVINNAAVGEVAELFIFDMEGTELVHSSLNQTATQIETDNLPFGIYYYRIVFKLGDESDPNSRPGQSGKLVSLR